MRGGSVSSRARVLVTHCKVQAHGGACGVLAWTLEALRRDYDVTLLTAAPFDLAALNRTFGTSLTAQDFRIRSIPPVLRQILAFDPDPGSVQQYCYLMRMVKRMRRDFDCVLTTDNEADLGETALQYVHVPNFEHVYPRLAPNMELPLRGKLAAWRDGRIRPWMAIADFSFDRMKRNRTLVNSDWTGRRVRQLYQIDTVTLYPPSPGKFPDVAWEDREDGFVVIGRLNPDKRPDWCLRVLKTVRRWFPQIKLHIAGTASRFWDEAAFRRKLIPLVAANSSWATLHENLSREELQRLVVGCKYGMHAMRDEHFGMAVAEMVRAGSIPFVHNSGGPLEIVDFDSRVIYDSEEDAARKIVSVLGSPAAQADISAKLAQIRDRFRPEAFVSGMRDEVARMLRR
jgi:glycosyltransferase involved in cell wall biosynthesis